MAVEPIHFVVPLTAFMEKNYNYERKKLRLPEYGRHIHQMVEYLMSIQDRDLRNSQARVVVDIMGNLNPVLRDTADFAHKLWDHLFIISNFQLDVDSPYPRPSSEMLAPKPDKLAYPDKKISFKQYGKNIEHMLMKLAEETDEPAKTMTAVNIAKYMKAKSFEYNQEHPNNEVILNDIRRMSKDAIQIDENAINSLKTDYKQTQNGYKNRKNYSTASHSSSKPTARSNKSNQKRRSNNRAQYGK